MTCLESVVLAKLQQYYGVERRKVDAQSSRAHGNLVKKKKKLRRWRGESSKGEDVSDFRCRNFDVAASRDIWIFTSASVADGMSTNLLAAVDSGNAGVDFFFFLWAEQQPILLPIEP